MRYVFFFYLLLWCACREREMTARSGTSYPGIYTTCKLNIMDRVKVEMDLQGRVFRAPVAMLYLREDNTYVMGFCDNQVREAGRYFCAGDTIYLYDRCNIEEQADLPALKVLLNVDNEIIYFTRQQYDQQAENMYTQIIPLKKNLDYAHVGFLRGQDLSYDSLVRYYRQRSVEEQNLWTDSVLRSRQRH